MLFRRGAENFDRDRIQFQSPLVASKTSDGSSLPKLGGSTTGPSRPLAFASQDRGSPRFRYRARAGKKHRTPLIQKGCPQPNERQPSSHPNDREPSRPLRNPRPQPSSNHRMVGRAGMTHRQSCAPRVRPTNTGGRLPLSRKPQKFHISICQAVSCNPTIRHQPGRSTNNEQIDSENIPSHRVQFRGKRAICLAGVVIPGPTSAQID